MYADFVSGACSVVTRLSSRTGITAARKKVSISFNNNNNNKLYSSILLFAFKNDTNLMALLRGTSSFL